MKTRWRESNRPQLVVVVYLSIGLLTDWGGRNGERVCFDSTTGRHTMNVEGRKRRPELSLLFLNVHYLYDYSGRGVEYKEPEREREHVSVLCLRAVCEHWKWHNSSERVTFFYTSPQSSSFCASAGGAGCRWCPRRDTTTHKRRRRRSALLRGWRGKNLPPLLIGVSSIK